MRPRGATYCLAVILGAALAGGPANALEKVSIASIPSLFRLPLFIAVVNKDFEAENLEPELVDTRSGADRTKMLAAGAIQYAGAQFIDGALLTKRQLNVRGIAMLTNRMSNSIVVRKDLTGQIRKVEDIKGRQMGVTSVGSGTWQFAALVAKSAGFSADDINFISIGSGPIVMQAVKAKRVELLSYSDPENFELVRNGDAEFLIDTADPATHKRLVGGEYLNNQIMVLKSYIDEHPQQVQAFVNAIQRGINWINAHSPAEIADALRTLPIYQRVDKQVLTETIRRQLGDAYQRTAAITEDAYMNAMKFPLSIGAIKEEIPMDALVDNRFAEAAAKTYPPGAGKPKH